MSVFLPGTYHRCLAGGHYYAVVRGDEECQICEQLTELRSQLSAATQRIAELEQDRKRMDYCEKELVVSWPSPKLRPGETLRQRIDSNMADAARGVQAGEQAEG